MQLSRGSIVAAALDILDNYGFPDMTMRRVASHLNVAPGALYWHVANKQELITAIAEEIVSDVHHSDASVSPIQLSELFRTCLLRHRDGAEIVTASMSQPNSVVHSQVLDSFLRSISAQFHSRETTDMDLQSSAYGLVHLTLGSVLIEQSSKQYAADTGQEETAPKIELSRRSVELLLEGLRHS
ncbi:TetR family transcriptional regulator [Corynebacterium lubricantis]|uniref:TetR family transcriptional regulator n=1 Tax=Corynebacterium lubricantis TaxID=541095 RepID=UPI00036F8103|nr:TetR family transcriptional regulator [Corynebacterium lubricantis]